MEKVKTVFFGSGEFAVPILKKLLEHDLIELTAVVTQPDKPAGRKQQLTPVPVKAFLNQTQTKVKIYEPTSYRNNQMEILESEIPELVVVADYGQILLEETINYPKYKCLNIHGSLLPDLRGAVPIPIAILRGYEKTGVSIPIMTVGLDNGPILASRETSIEQNDTTSSLKRKLSEDGAELLIEILPEWISGKINPVTQDETKATNADKSLISKEKARFTSEVSVIELDRMVRAFNPWPIAWCEIELNAQKKRLKIYSAKISEIKENSNFGEIQKTNDGISLVLRDGMLGLTELQLEGKPVGEGKDYLYLNGVKVF